MENSERLALLNQATGTSPSSENPASFQNRLDAILSTSSSPERSYVADEEFEAREQARVETAQKEVKASQRLEELSPARYNPEKIKVAARVADSSVFKNSKLDGTEKNYQRAKEEIQKEFDERIKNTSLEASKKRNVPDFTGNKLEPDSPLPSNPFYAGEKTDLDPSSFESRKAVMVNRLVERGFAPENARAQVGQAASQEDLIIALVKDSGLTYGEALDVTT